MRAAAAGSVCSAAGRNRSLLRNFMDALAYFAHQRLAEELIAAVATPNLLLTGRLTERGRDLGFCRQRLRHLYESLESPRNGQDEELTSSTLAPI